MNCASGKNEKKSSKKGRKPSVEKRKKNSPKKEAELKGGNEDERKQEIEDNEKAGMSDSQTNSTDEKVEHSDEVEATFNDKPEWVDEAEAVDNNAVICFEQIGESTDDKTELQDNDHDRTCDDKEHMENEDTCINESRNSHSVADETNGGDDEVENGMDNNDNDKTKGEAVNNELDEHDRTCDEEVESFKENLTDNVEEDTDKNLENDECDIKENLKSGVSFGIEEEIFEDDTFSEFIDRLSVNEALALCSQDNDGHDVQVGEGLIVQYLKRQDKKHLKMTLRSASWSVTHELRRNLWYQICHYLHKADDENIYADFAEELFPGGK